MGTCHNGFQLSGRYQGFQPFPRPQVIAIFGGRDSESSVTQPKLNFDEDYYSVLEVSPSADERTLKKAYYKMVFKYHPDNKEGAELKELCNRQMMVINGAYKILKDSQARALYDQKRRIGVYGNAASVKVQNQKSGAKSSTNTPKATSTGRNTKSNSDFSNARDSDVGSSRRQYRQMQDEEDDAPTESMADIFAEMFRDIALNKGNRILNDVNDFLNSQITGEPKDGTSSSSMRGGAPGRNNRKQQYDRYTAEELASEVVVLQTACSHLKEHIADLKGALSIEESLLAFSSSEQSSSTTTSEQTSNSRVAALEERLRRIETVKGLQARISEAQGQLKQLKDDLDFAVAAQLRSKFGASSGSSDADSVYKSSYDGVYDNVYDSVYQDRQKYTSTGSDSSTYREAQAQADARRQQQQQQRRRKEATEAVAAQEARRKDAVESELQRMKAAIRKK